MSSARDIPTLNSPSASVAGVKPHILIIDDEPIFRKAVRLHLEREGFRVSEASRLEEARRALGLTQMSSSEEETPPLPAIEVVLCDWRLEVEVNQELQEQSGLTLVEELRLTEPSLEPRRPNLLFMSAHASQRIALRSIELGASDFIMKPFEMSELLFRVKRLLREREQQRRLHEVEAHLSGGGDQVGALISRSPKMLSLFNLMRRVAPTQSKLLIQGESGTGKELVARAVHLLSQAESGEAPFIALNCASLPESLIESELFGHTQGAFTHAHHDRRGLIEEADGGTLFLDEIGELPLHLQAKLLRVIQEGEVRRLGANQTKSLEVRFIAATLKNLASEVSEGRFRADLYYRLNVITLDLPPLRDRLEDLPLLVHQLLTRLCDRLKRPRPTLSSRVLELFQRHDWPGNVRELENALEHALILSDTSVIKMEHLPQKLWSLSSSPSHLHLNKGDKIIELLNHSSDQSMLSIKQLTRSLEELLIREALERTGGVKTQAAKMLEISTKTLLYKLRDYQIDFDD